MKKILYIFIYLLTVHSVKAQEEGFFGGIEAGLSTTKINIDTLSTKFSFSPLIGFSFQKQIVPKLYIGLATTFTQKNATISSPSLKYQLNYVDWKLSLQYKLSPSLFIEGGAAVSQFIGGRKKITNGDVINQNDVFFSQTNPYFGLRYKLKENLISIKYYLPKVLTSAGSLSSLNQFSYGEISLKIPFKSNSADKIEKEEKSDEEAFKEVQALKSGILLVVLSGSSSKDVKDRVADQLIVEAFKSYSFSKFFIVDDSDIDSLRRTNRIAVYENYPFVEKQTINLENFTWFTINAGKANITERNNETFNMKSLTIMNFKGEKLKSPFPYFVNYSEGNMVKAIESLNAQLERFYYEATFGL